MSTISAVGTDSATFFALRESFPLLVVFPALVGFAAHSFLESLVSASAGVELDAVATGLRSTLVTEDDATKDA